MTEKHTTTKEIGMAFGNKIKRYIPIPNCFVCPFLERVELPNALNTLDGKEVKHLMKCSEQDKTFDIDDMGIYQMWEVHSSCPLPKLVEVEDKGKGD